MAGKHNTFITIKDVNLIKLWAPRLTSHLKEREIGP